jgi:hypothetical protein
VQKPSASFLRDWIEVGRYLAGYRRDSFGIQRSPQQARRSMKSRARNHQPAEEEAEFVIIGSEDDISPDPGLRLFLLPVLRESLKK